MYVPRFAHRTYMHRQPCWSNNECSFGHFCNNGGCERYDRFKSDATLIVDVREEIARRAEQRRRKREADIYWESKPLSWRLFIVFISLIVFVIVNLLVFHYVFRDASTALAAGILSGSIVFTVLVEPPPRLPEQNKD